MITEVDDANVSRAKMDVKTIEKAVVAYRVKNGHYPESLEYLATQQPERAIERLAPRGWKVLWSRTRTRQDNETDLEI